MIEVACNLCGGTSIKVRFPATLHQNEALNVDAFRCTSPGYGHHPRIVQCTRCGYVYASPRWSDEELLAAYTAVEDETYVHERAGRELTFRKHLQALEKVVGPANGRSLLDIGAYIGVFVQVAAQRGWDAWGVEPSDWAAAEAQRHGLNVIAGTQYAPELAGRQFDVITMWDVIEHVTDPKSEIRHARELLRPGGVLVLHTMDIDSLLARLMGTRWPWLMDMHLHYFSQKTMRAMLEDVGFRVLWSGAQGRYLRLGYLATRLGGLHGGLGRLVETAVRRLRLAEIPVPVNFGDLFTVYAQRV